MALARASHDRRRWACDGEMRCLAQAYEVVPQVRRRAGRERRPEAGRLGDLGMRHGLQPLADASAGRYRLTETLAGTARIAVSPAVPRLITRWLPRYP